MVVSALIVLPGQSLAIKRIQKKDFLFRIENAFIRKNGILSSRDGSLPGDRMKRPTNILEVSEEEAGIIIRARNDQVLRRSHEIIIRVSSRKEEADRMIPGKILHSSILAWIVAER